MPKVKMSAYMTNMIFISALCAGRKEVRKMPDKLMLSAVDVAALLGIAKPTAYALIRRLNPDCGFVLLDKLEQMDTDTLREFGEWLEAEGLQAIATRVSTGDECSVIIEDGYVKASAPLPSSEPSKQWIPGNF